MQKNQSQQILTEQWRYMKKLFKATVEQKNCYLITKPC